MNRYRAFQVGYFSLQTWSIEWVQFLPAANGVCEGYVFTRVCHSVHRGGGSDSGSCQGQSSARRQADQDSQQYNKSHRVKSQRALVLGERCWGTGTNNEWLECYITGIDKENRCYQVVFEDTGRSLRRTRSHLRPRGPDFPHISERFLQQNAALSQNSVLSEGEGENQANNEETSVLSGPPHNSEEDTVVDFVSDAPAERAITFNDNPVDETRYTFH